MLINFNPKYKFCQNRFTGSQVYLGHKNINIHSLNQTTSWVWGTPKRIFPTTTQNRVLCDVYNISLFYIIQREKVVMIKCGVTVELSKMSVARIRTRDLSEVFLFTIWRSAWRINTESNTLPSEPTVQTKKNKTL